MASNKSKATHKAKAKNSNAESVKRYRASHKEITFTFKNNVYESIEKEAQREGVTVKEYFLSFFNARPNKIEPEVEIPDEYKSAIEKLVQDRLAEELKKKAVIGDHDPFTRTEVQASASASAPKLEEEEENEGAIDLNGLANAEIK